MMLGEEATVTIHRPPALLLVAIALAACGGDDAPTRPAFTPTPTPVVTPPEACQLNVTCDPIAGFPGIYKCQISPAGPASYIVNGVSQGSADGILFASSGDLIAACRDGCNCSLPVRLR